MGRKEILFNLIVTIITMIMVIYNGIDTIKMNKSFIVYEL